MNKIGIALNEKFDTLSHARSALPSPACGRGVGRGRFAPKYFVKLFIKRYKMILLALCAASCTQAPPINASRDLLWQQFAHQPLDKLLLAWGTPAGETKLTNGSRLVMYRHATIYDVSPSTSCEVSFLAAPPHYRIDNIAMVGDSYECYLLTQGQHDIRHINDLPPPGFYPYPYPYR